ncbi:MAG TPA: hypothetical protein ENK85_12295 [Saprospiraceae bacterium]|nr:hypothetical protein [Saprospiraceae bacterium]
MLKKALDIFLYSNLFIALCAVSLLWSSELMAFSRVVIGPYDGFVFFSSLFVYGAHRLVGIHKLKANKVNERHDFVRRIEPLVIILGIIGLLGPVFLFFGLSTMQQVLMIFPGVISLGYIIPFSRKGKRLRDFPFIKVFLIAFTWAWVTVIVPLWEIRPNGIWWLYFERFFFILAITLPFDIRDVNLDKLQKTKTLPLLIGVEKTKRLAFISLGLALILGIIYLLFFSLQYAVVNGYVLAGLYTFYFINKVEQDANDYLFTGWLDGTMIIQFLVIQLFVYLINP